MTAGTALAIVYTIGWIPFYLIRAESLQDALTQYGRNEGIAAVATSAAVSTHVTLSCLTLFFTDQPISLWSASLMVVIYLAGVAFWVWARRLIAPLDIQRLPDEVPAELFRHGAFGIVRNPLYFAMLICTMAPLAAAPRLYLAASFTVCFVALALRALQDEARMRKQLGSSYEDYSRDVKRLIPFVW